MTEQRIHDLNFQSGMFKLATDKFARKLTDTFLQV